MKLFDNLKKRIADIRKRKEEQEELDRIWDTEWFKSTSSLMARMDNAYKEENANTNLLLKSTIEMYNQIEGEITKMKAYIEKPRKTLRFANLSPNPDPSYAKEGDSGFDLMAWISQTTEGAFYDEKMGEMCVEINPNEVKLIHTGMYFDIPDNCEIQTRPRSGFALKVGLSLNNSPGTIDVGYTGEVGLICINPTKTPIRVYHGRKIAQAVLCPVYNERLVQLVKVDKIEKNSDRSSKGFGHSGV